MEKEYEYHNDIYDICPKCGSVKKNGICQGCGRRRTSQTPDHSAQLGKEPSPSKSNHSKGAVLTIALIVIIIVLGIVGLFFYQNPAGKIMKQNSAVSPYFEHPIEQYDEDTKSPDLCHSNHFQ